MFCVNQREFKWLTRLFSMKPRSTQLYWPYSDSGTEKEKNGQLPSVGFFTVFPRRLRFYFVLIATPGANISQTQIFFIISLLLLALIVHLIQKIMSKSAGFKQPSYPHQKFFSKRRGSFAPKRLRTPEPSTDRDLTVNLCICRLRI